MGLFWDDNITAGELRRGRKRSLLRLRPDTPDTGWRPVREFPNLSAASIISLDTETKDPHLLEHGPGWARNDGHIVGISLSVPDNAQRWYFPMRHTVDAEYNLDPQAVLRYMKDTLGNPAQPKTGANLIYDCGWLAEEGVTVRGDCYDVQFAEALLEEIGDTDLGYLGKKYLGEGKETEQLYEWCASAYGGPADGSQRANIWRASPLLVGPYAESDAYLPFEILKRQWRIMKEQGLLDVFRMECRLIPLLIAMRQKGVRVDLNKAEEIRSRLLTERDALYAEVLRLTGVKGFDVWSADSLATVFDSVGLSYSRTAKGAPSFRKVFLENCDHQIGKLICSIREAEKLVGTFVDGYIFNGNVNGFIHGSFHPLRGRDGGARSGRFSSSLPNLQNIPSRSKWGKWVRSIFVPDEGHVQWIKHDYSQIEYRFLAHFAIGTKSDELRETYRRDPDADFHVVMQNLIKTYGHKELERSSTKTINFGLTYGMGKEKLMRSLGVTMEEAEAIFAAYHTGAPFVDATASAATAFAQTNGYITTILGRRSRFDLWEPKNWRREFAVQPEPLPYERALAAYGPYIQRAGTHKAMNRILQGSSADQMKTAMLRCWEDGVFDAIGVPRLTVHDELDFSDPGGCEEGFKELQHVMETCLDLAIPITAKGDKGPSWGEVA